MAVYDDISRTLEELIGNGDPGAVRARLDEYDIRDVQAVWVAVWPGHSKPELNPNRTNPKEIAQALISLDLVEEV